MFEILSNRILLNRRIKVLLNIKITCFFFIMKLFVKILYKYNKKHNYNACDYK